MIGKLADAAYMQSVSDRLVSLRDDVAKLNTAFLGRDRSQIRHGFEAALFHALTASVQSLDSAHWLADELARPVAPKPVPAPQPEATQEAASWISNP